LCAFEVWLRSRMPGGRFHFALMAGPYLELLLKGTKRIESRFSKNRTAPFGILCSGDVVFFQTVGGHIDALGKVEHCKFLELSGSHSAHSVMREYRDGLQLLPEFMERKKHACYATLIWFKSLIPAKGPQVVKSDRRGWVSLNGERYLPGLR
jgi:hypothetical protein